MEVTLSLLVADHESPGAWDWPTLLDMLPEEVRVINVEEAEDGGKEDR